MDRFVWFVVQRKLAVLVVFLIATVFFAFGAAKIQNNVIVQHLFPYDHPYLKLHESFSRVFGGGGSGVVIAVKVKQGDIFNEKTLKKIKGITEEIELWDEVYRVLTASLASQPVKTVKAKGKGEIEISSLMYPRVPKDEKEMQELKKNIFSNPAYDGTLVSEDGTSALILTVMQDNIPYKQMFAKLRALIAKYEDENTSLHIVGFPMLMGWIYSYQTQMYIVFAFSITAMILILFLVFRSVLGMVAPIAVSLICTALGLGFVGWTGINFSPLLYVLAFLVGARMVSNAVQITHRYIEEFVRTNDRKEAAFITTRTMWMPNAAAVATDVAGFAILGIAKIVLMQQLAVIMSFWMATITLEGLLVPIICSYLPLNRDKIRVRKDGSGPIARLSGTLGRFSMGIGKYVVIVVVVVLLVTSVWQTGNLKVGDPTPGSPILWPNDTYNKDQALINKSFNASSETLVLYYEGTPESVYDPIVMKTFEGFVNHMAERLPDIYKTSNSIIDIGKMVSLQLHDGDNVFYRIPWGSEQLMGLLGYLSATAGSSQLRRYFDPALKRTQITLYFADHTSDNLLRIKEAAWNFFKEHPLKTEHGEFKLAGGSIGMEIGLNEEMKKIHAEMDAMVLAMIFIMCTIAFRSAIAGLMLTVPLILSNLIAFAYMSVMNIGLSVNTLPCSAVGVGVGVDFAIYLYSRCIEEYPRYKDYRSTIMAAVTTTGEAVLFTGVTLVVPLMAWYYISGLKFQAEMGFFLSMLLLINMITCVTLHPLLLLLVRPRFLRRGVLEQDQEEVPETCAAQEDNCEKTKGRGEIQYNQKGETNG